jgi:hypothetical protein
LKSAGIAVHIGEYFKKAPTFYSNLSRLLNPLVLDRVLLTCHPERWPMSELGFIQAELLDKVIALVKKFLKARN